MDLYGLFILGVNIKYVVCFILYRHIDVPMAFKGLTTLYEVRQDVRICYSFLVQH